MLTLYDNPFSPFTRKVRMVLEYKRVPYHSIDALALDCLPQLRAQSVRAEVPVLVDGDLTIVESADIVAYLEDLHPAPPVMPDTPQLRAKARHWQRIADRVLDPILHDISLWTWPTHRRTDGPPGGLVQAGQRDLGIVIDELETALGGDEYLCGSLSVADFAMFPHVPALKLVGVPLEADHHPRVVAWARRMSALDVVQRDLDGVRRAAARLGSGTSPYEGEKVVWRGDRIEWLLSNGFDVWWSTERASGRAVVPRSLGSARTGR